MNILNRDKGFKGKLKTFRKKLKKKNKELKKKGFWKKAFVVIITIAFLATTILPYIFI